jgi:hypothetical protein
MRVKYGSLFGKYRAYTKEWCGLTSYYKFTSHPTRAQHILSTAGLSNYLTRYQQFVSQAYCGAAGLVSKMASQQEKAFCVLNFEVSRSVTTVQRVHCNLEHTVSLLLLRRHLGNWSCGPAVSMRDELLVAHGKLGLFPQPTVYVVPV